MGNCLGFRWVEFRSRECRVLGLSLLGFGLGFKCIGRGVG